jgi:hypothetical protein
MLGQSAAVDEIVVDLSHASAVERALGNLSAADRARLHLSRRPPERRAIDERLGLALLEIEYAKGFEPTSPTAVRAILKHVRDEFWAKYRWSPTMGRNRVLSHVGAGNHADDAAGGSSYIQGGGLLPTSYIQGGAKAASYIQGGGGGFPRSVNSIPTSVARPTTGRGVQVAVLDTPIFPNSAIAGGYLASKDSRLTPNKRGHFYLAGHSTFVTGLIAAKAPGAAIQVHGVLHPRNAGAKVWDVAVAMTSLVGTGTDVLNLSMGCFTSDDEPPLVLMRAVDALTPDVVIVAAAGNYRGLKKRNGKPISARPFWPGALDNVVAVGGLAKNERLATFSPDYPWVDLYARAKDVTSTYIQGTVTFPDPPATAASDWPPKAEQFEVAATWSGTSFAAGTVSGAIAARTIPGRRPAAQALQEILSGADSDITRHP